MYSSEALSKEKAFKLGSEKPALPQELAHSMSEASSQEDLPPFPTPEVSSIELEGKANAKIHYTYYPASKSEPNHPNPFSKSLVVYLNGLMSPRSSWDLSISSFLEKRIQARLPYPALLSYDRYGQGDSDHDPDDKDPPPSHSHDVMSAVHSLRQFLLQIWKEHLDITNPTSFPSIIFVCNSIGCAIARLFAQTYPGTVSGMLLLDSIIANSDMVSLWPDPDAKDFDPGALPPGVSEDDVRDTREKYRRMFHPDVPNREGLSRRNLAKLLPSASHPKLEGYGGSGPYLTVVGHDWEEFARQGFEGSMHTPKLLTMTFLNPTWQKYNEGLTHITDKDKALGPIPAVGCGHFIQTDGPGFVSDELFSLLDRVVNRVEQLKESDRGSWGSGGPAIESVWSTF
jgi:pimeloyl-ACP methyl ester carboxylesterase